MAIDGGKKEEVTMMVLSGSVWNLNRHQSCEGRRGSGDFESERESCEGVGNCLLIEKD